jgi:hypothetical protein
MICEVIAMNEKEKGEEQNRELKRERKSVIKPSLNWSL